MTAVDIITIYECSSTTYRVWLCKSQFGGVTEVHALAVCSNSRNVEILYYGVVIVLRQRTLEA